MSSTVVAWLKFLVRPRVLVPILLTVALLAFAFSVTDLPKVMGDIRRLSVIHVMEVFALACGYLILKATQLRFLLNGLAIHADWKTLLLAFSIGEMTLPIPSGVYAQNYVLRRIHGSGFALSSAATTLTLMIEGALVLLALVVLSIPKWQWLRYFLLLFLGLAALVTVALVRSSHLRRLLTRQRTGWLERLFKGIRDLLDGLRALIAPRILWPSVLLSLAYLMLLILAFYVIGRGVGVSGLTLEQATTIYFFSLGVTLLLGGVMTQLGVLEVAGLGAAQAWGYTLSQGLAMFLGFRIVWMGSIWLLSGFVVWRLRGELRRST